MNPDSENFEPLCKLMALKRHEQPPPGYFSRLPDKIALRIERGDGPLNFWEWLLAGYAFQPAIAYSFALAAFGALAFSVINTVKTAPANSDRILAGNGWRVATPKETPPTSFNSSDSLHFANWMGNSNPGETSPALPSTFGSPDHFRTLPVSFEAGTP
jgi:hypothetical protein